MPIHNRKKWIELAASACAHAGVAPEAIEIIVTWDQTYCANAVYRLPGGRILKLFGPTAERQFYIERSVLRTLAGHPVIAAPRLVAEAVRTGEPPYLILTEIPGATAEEVWDELPRNEQLALAREFGKITAAIHRLPQDDLAAVERRFGGKEVQAGHYQARWTPRIKQEESLAPRQRDDLLAFLQGEAQDLINGPSRLTHYDLAHNHLYLARENGAWQVTGFIDWAEATLGPPEWDVVYLWFWTFSGDREAMRACLDTLYAGPPPPDRFARRCLAAVFHTSSMGLLWPDFLAQGGNGGPITREMTAFFFPEELFGPPD